MKSLTPHQALPQALSGWVVLLVLVAGIVLQTSLCVRAAVAVDDPPLPTIDEVGSCVEGSLLSLHTIAVTYRQQHLVNPDCPIDSSASQFDREPHQWTWQSSGAKVSLYREQSAPGAANFSRGVHATFDGTTVFNAHYDDADPSRMKLLQIGEAVDTQRLMSTFTPDTWIGRTLNWSDDTLLTLVTSRQARIVGWVSVEGHRCLQLELGGARLTSGEPLPCEVWLDPNRDWLPRKLVLWRQYPEPYGTIPCVQVVSEFQKTPDRSSGNERWFPKVVECRYRVIHRSEVLSVAVNETMDEGTFRIAPQVGTQVMDMRGGDARSGGRSFIYGGHETLADRRQSIVTMASTQAPPVTSSSVDASPRSSTGYLSIFSWMLGVVLSTWAVLIWVKR